MSPRTKLRIGWVIVLVALVGAGAVLVAGMALGDDPRARGWTNAGMAIGPLAIIVIIGVRSWQRRVQKAAELGAAGQ